MLNIIETYNLTKNFRRCRAVSNVSFQIKKGSLVTLLGPNGAGKTTTLKMLVDLIRPNSGSIEVLGLNPVKDGVAIRRRVGYVPERPRMIGWMTIDQIIMFVSRYYPSWDMEYSQILRDTFNLKPGAKVRSLSRGEEAKLALLLALSHRPELLILDDATSGIDPIARKEIIEGLIAHLHREGTSVLFATHIVHEVEGLANSVIIMDNSKLVCHEDLESLKSCYKRIRCWNVDEPESMELPEEKVISKRIMDRECEYILKNFDTSQWKTRIADNHYEISDMSLEEIYLVLASGNKE